MKHFNAAIEKNKGKANPKPKTRGEEQECDSEENSSKG